MKSNDDVKKLPELMVCFLWCLIFLLCVFCVSNILLKSDLFKKDFQQQTQEEFESKPVGEEDLSNLISTRDELKDKIFNDAIHYALKDNVITVRELRELYKLAKDIRYKRAMQNLKSEAKENVQISKSQSSLQVSYLLPKYYTTSADIIF